MRPSRSVLYVLASLALLAGRAECQMARPRAPLASPAPAVRVPTDSLARLVTIALDAPAERDQELFEAVACQLFRLNWSYGVDATEAAAARMTDSVLATPELRARFEAVTDRWPARVRSWARCSARDLPRAEEDLAVEQPDARPVAPVKPARPRKKSPR